MEARTLLEESLGISRELGDRRSTSIALCCLGDVAHSLGEYTGAQALFEESLGVSRELGDKYLTATSLYGLGNVAQSLGEYEAALSLHLESLVLRRVLGDMVAVAEGLEGVAAAFLALGDATRAVLLCGAADSLREGIGAPPTAVERTKRTEAEKTARAILDDAAFAGALAEGRGLTWEQAVDMAMGGGPH